MAAIVFEGLAQVGAQRLPGWRQPQEVVGRVSFPAGRCIPAGNSSTRRNFCDCRQRANVSCLRHTGSRSASTGATRLLAGCQRSWNGTGEFALFKLETVLSHLQSGLCDSPRGSMRTFEYRLVAAPEKQKRSNRDAAPLSEFRPEPGSDNIALTAITRRLPRR